MLEFLVHFNATQEGYLIAVLGNLSYWHKHASVSMEQKKVVGYKSYGKFYQMAYDMQLEFIFQ